MFKIGDLVILQSGGNKMKVVKIENDSVTCAWICVTYKEKKFKNEDILLYENYTHSHDRQETIKTILNSQ